LIIINSAIALYLLIGIVIFIIGLFALRGELKEAGDILVLFLICVLGWWGLLAAWIKEQQYT
jgi:uncharacterized membrane protein YiaA